MPAEGRPEAPGVLPPASARVGSRPARFLTAPLPPLPLPLCLLPARPLCAVTALASLRDAATNWDSQTAGVPGEAWVGNNPCGATDGSQPAWKGVTCGPGGQVTRLVLSELGLAGTLPGGLAAMRSLTLLDLSDNAFEGGLPPAWLAPEGFASLATADLSRNRLEGGWVGGQMMVGGRVGGWVGGTCSRLRTGCAAAAGTAPAAFKAALPVARLHRHRHQ